MKLKVACILLTGITLSFMWYFSPLYADVSRPTVETISAKSEHIFDTVMTHGYVEETNKKILRLDKTSVVNTVYCSVGDYVNEGSVILDVCEKENEFSDISSVYNFLPEISDISDINDFYIPSKIDEALSLTPEIAAPISGVITNINVKEGDIALGQMPLVTISDFSHLTVKTSIPELYIKRIALGQSAEITGEAFSGKKYTATVKEISPVASKKTSLTGDSETTVDVILDITSTSTNLRPGYSVNAKIFTAKHLNAITVPYTCIFQEEDKEYVYKVKDGRLAKTAIKTGLELDERVEVLKGVDLNDNIVNNPHDDLSDGLPVKIGE